MGTRVPEPPIDYGNDCPVCTPPAGSLWAAGETPLFVYVYFQALESCPWLGEKPPNGQTFKLTQRDDKPCMYEHIGSVWKVQWWAWDVGDNQSHVYLWGPAGFLHFHAESVPCPPECHIYTNLWDWCGHPAASINGLAVVHWMGVVLSIIVGMHLPTDTQIMHEVFVKDEDKIVHKLCITDIFANIKFLME